MPVINGTGAFSIGRDCTIILMGPFGRVQIDNVTGFDPKQITQPVKVDRLDGVQLAAEIPKGWTGKITFDRGSSAVDDMFALIETAWYVAGTLTAATIYQYVAEIDGSTSTYQFDQASLKYDPGSWVGDAPIKCSIDFEANRRRKV